MGDRNKVLEACLSQFIGEYGFNIASGANGLAFAQKSGVRIEAQFAGKDGGELEIWVVNPSRVPAKKYIPLYMAAMAAPEVIAARYSKGENGEVQDVCARIQGQIGTVISDLVRWYPEVLQGNFSTLETEDRYDRFVSEVDSLTLGPLAQLPYSDPIKQKFWRCDFSWVFDLKRRLSEAQGITADPKENLGSYRQLGRQ